MKRGDRTTANLMGQLLEREKGLAFWHSLPVRERIEKEQNAAILSAP